MFFAQSPTLEMLVVLMNPTPMKSEVYVRQFRSPSCLELHRHRSIRWLKEDGMI